MNGNSERKFAMEMWVRSNSARLHSTAVLGFYLAEWDITVFGRINRLMDKLGLDPWVDAERDLRMRDAATAEAPETGRREATARA